MGKIKTFKDALDREEKLLIALVGMMIVSGIVFPIMLSLDIEILLYVTLITYLTFLFYFIKNVIGAMKNV